MMENLRQDHVTLLAMDAERSLQGLVHSLSMGVTGMSKGALHAIDLVSALASVGLTSASHLMQSVAQELAAGQPLVLGVAQEFSAWLEHALHEIRSGHAFDAAPSEDKLAGWVRQLQGLPKQAAPQAGAFDGLGQSINALDPAQAALLPAPALQAFQKNGLDLLQYARVLNLAPAHERSLQRIDNLLAELQDRAAQIGQRSLRELYDQHHSEIDACLLDQAIFQALEAFSPVSDRAQRITAVQRHLTLFIDWQGLTLSPQEMQGVGLMLASWHGHVKPLDHGYRLVLPCSQRRMWLQPFEQDGRNYAISAAQVLETVEAQAGQTAKLEVCAGTQRATLHAARCHTPVSMNIHPIPANLPRPPGVSAVALNGQGEVFLFRNFTGS
jgi:hypothetical protein